ncbi:hypothetical protein BJ508DRAFT_349406 [Ascobolus immersus RN42]|uniref:Uncharacterized protein n=1 Tax=Ascobolus immersus RN42 TaxID=1160509 RepID=A0A3N4HZF8_ASCIM|nr:hypothetical protein BJ508DRAFT_349406 [Ascobolus immersus RN42]
MFATRLVRPSAAFWVSPSCDRSAKRLRNRRRSLVSFAVWLHFLYILEPARPRNALLARATQQNFPFSNNNNSSNLTVAISLLGNTHPRCPPLLAVHIRSLSTFARFLAVGVHIYSLSTLAHCRCPHLLARQLAVHTYYQLLWDHMVLGAMAMARASFMALYRSPSFAAGPRHLAHGLSLLGMIAHLAHGLSLLDMIALICMEANILSHRMAPKRKPPPDPKPIKRTRSTRNTQLVPVDQLPTAPNQQDYGVQFTAKASLDWNHIFHALASSENLRSFIAKSFKDAHIAIVCEYLGLSRNQWLSLKGMLVAQGSVPKG